MEQERPPCIVDGCPNRVRHPRDKHCKTHEYRRTHGIPLEAPLRAYGQTAAERLRAAALAFATSDAMGGTESDRAWHRLRMAAKAYGRKKSSNEPPERLGDNTST